MYPLSPWIVFLAISYHSIEINKTVEIVRTGVVNIALKKRNSWLNRVGIRVEVLYDYVDFGTQFHVTWVW